jgi:ketosteroid isomerase-like protein
MEVADQVVHPFRSAIEARDLDAAVALLREDVVFRSPVVFKPYHGRDAMRVILGAVLAVFEDFRYVREIGADIETGARDHALVFEARVGDKQIEGCDFIQLDDDGAISAFTVMVRPMSGMLALAEAMKAQLSSA